MLPEGASGHLVIRSITGTELMKFVIQSGLQLIEFSRESLCAGIYLYSLETKNFGIITKKMIITD